MIKENSCTEIAPTSKSQTTKEGFVLLTSILLGSIIMAMALIMIQIMGKELAFNAALYNTEKAYYHAEGGIETGLLILSEEALNHVEGKEEKNDLGDLEWSLDIDNLVKSGAYFENNEITLGANQIQTFRYARDKEVGSDERYDIAEPGALSVNTEPTEDYNWRFICKDNLDDTKSLQNIENGAIDNILRKNGEYNNTLGAVASGNFSAWKTAQNIKTETCYLQLQNLSSADMTFTLTPKDSNGFAPLRSRLEAKGQSGNQEKVVRFFYDQNGIGTALNFSFINYQEN